jgi:hypothetical protein
MILISWSVISDAGPIHDISKCLKDEQAQTISPQQIWRRPQLQRSTIRPETTCHRIRRFACSQR